LANQIHTRQVPLAKTAVLFSIGIVLFRFTSPLEVISIIHVVVLLLFSLLVYSITHYKGKSAVLMFIIVSSGFLVSMMNDIGSNNLNLPEVVLEANPTLGVEVEEIRRYNKSIALLGSITSVNDIKRMSPRVILFGKKDDTHLENIKRGVNLTFTSDLEIIGQSDDKKYEGYNSYLIDQGIVYRGFINPGQYQMSETQMYPWWRMLRYDARDWAIENLDSKLDGDTNAITRALLLGDKSLIRPETREMYANSGIIHILAVSGLHVGFIVMLLIWIFDRVFFKLGPYSWMKVVSISLALLAYIELSGGAPPVRRAVIMAILYLVAKAMRKQFSPINILGFAALILLCISPNELFTVSFQLSFVAVGGIVLFIPYLMGLCKYENKRIRKLWGLISMGLAAQVATLPITFYYFHQFSVYSALAGVIAIPFTGFALCNGVLILLFGSISRELGSVLSLVQSCFIWILNAVAEFFSMLPFSLWKGVTLLPVESILLLLAVLGVAFYLNTKRSEVLVYAAFLLVFQAAIHTSKIAIDYNYIELGLWQDDSSIEKMVEDE